MNNLISQLIIALSRNKNFVVFSYNNKSLTISKLQKLWVLGFIYGFTKISGTFVIIFLKRILLELKKYLKKIKECKKIN